MLPQNSDSDRRNNQRHRTLKAGKIVFNGRTSVIDCIIRNMSPTGACIEVHTSLGIPINFELLIAQEHEHRPCRQVWRTKDRIGITFC